MIKPWKRLRTLRTHDFTILTIREDVMVHPRDGKEHPRVVIDCVDWVNVVALTADQQLVMVRQFRTGIDANTLEVPGGMIDAGEDPRLAVARELEEETGFRPQQVVPLGWVHPNPAIQSNRSHSYLATGCVKVHGGHLDEGEDIAVELHPWSEAPTLIQTGAVTHSLSVVAILLAERALTSARTSSP
jgi:ADP-ribose pyrophosphatase